MEVKKGTARQPWRYSSRSRRAAEEVLYRWRWRYFCGWYLNVAFTLLVPNCWDTNFEVWWYTGHHLQRFNVRWENRLRSFPHSLPWIWASKTTGSQQINLSHILDLIDPLDQCIVLGFNFLGAAIQDNLGFRNPKGSMLLVTKNNQAQKVGFVQHIRCSDVKASAQVTGNQLTWEKKNKMVWAVESTYQNSVGRPINVLVAPEKNHFGSVA